MNIVLRNNLILITTDFETLNASWMKEFLDKHTRGMLFLEKSVLVFGNKILTPVRERFLQELSKHYASKHEFSHEFFLRSMLKFATQPIKIELNKLEKPVDVNVHLYAYDKDTVLITLKTPNSWITNYMRSQLEVYVERGTDISLVVDVSDYKAKNRLDKMLNKHHVLHYNLKYSYDNDFISKLYSDFANFSFNDFYSSSKNDELKKYYTILECPIGASKGIIKKNYKKLSKVYHPDKVFSEDPDMLEYYTKKFQLLQEAYTYLVKHS